MASSLSIVIVNWNTGALLSVCCHSIARAELNGSALREIVIVDNASTDGSCDNLLDSGGLPIKIIRNALNLGFAVACNQGALEATGDLILLLNPDTCLFASSLREPMDFMTDVANAQVGICGIRLVGERGEDTISFAQFPTVAAILRSVVGLGLAKSNIRRLQACVVPHAMTVDQVIGAFFLIRTEVYSQLGGFDERFFVYYEEVDLSLRARQAGWRSVCLTGVAAKHVGGGATQQVKAKRLFYLLRSRLLYVRKHFSAMGMLSVFVTTLVFEPMARLLWALGTRSWQNMKDTASAYWMLGRWLPRWIFWGETR